MELSNPNMTHTEYNYCSETMTISTLQTGDKEMEAMEYVRSKEFFCVGAGIWGVFQNTKELHVIKYRE